MSNFTIELDWEFFSKCGDFFLVVRRGWMHCLSMPFGTHVTDTKTYVIGIAGTALYRVVQWIRPLSSSCLFIPIGAGIGTKVLAVWVLVWTSHRGMWLCKARINWAPQKGDNFERLKVVGCRCNTAYLARHPAYLCTVHFISNYGQFEGLVFFFLFFSPKSSISMLLVFTN